MKTPPSSEITQTIGLSLERSFEVLSGIASRSSSAARFKQFFLARAEQVMLDHIHIYAGTRHTLAVLKSNGSYISIVSTKRRERIEEAIHRDELEELVDDVIGGGCVRNNKPDPEGLLLAIARSEVSAQETIYVGDSPSDGECALRAGVPFIGLLSGQTRAGELSKWSPIRVFDSIEDLSGLDL